MKKIYLSLIALVFTFNFSYAQYDVGSDVTAIGLGATSTNPVYKFNYNGSSVANYGIGWFSDPSQTFGPMGYISAYSGFKFFTNASFNAILTKDGRLGLGTDNPTQKLSVAGQGFFFPSNASIDPGDGSGPALRMGYSSSNDFGYINANNTGSLSKYLILQPNGGNVGIGTTTPSARLQVNYAYTDQAGMSIQAGSSSGTALTIGGSAGDNGTSVVKIVPDWNTNASPYALDISPGGTTGANTRLLNISYSGSNKMVVTKDGAVGIGTTSPDALLTVNGTIHSKEVKVTSTVPAPDYVFEPEYKLTDLNELKAYLDKNHHLPEIPSAAQIEKDGIDLGNMNLKLLKKVEELTLYLIEKDNNDKKKDVQLQSQQEQINELKKQLTAITQTFTK